jgi:hypothetical protein
MQTRILYEEPRESAFRKPSDFPSYYPASSGSGCKTGDNSQE